MNIKLVLVVVEKRIYLKEVNVHRW